LPVVSVFPVLGVRVPQEPLTLALVVKRTGSLCVVAAVQVGATPGVQVTVAVTVRVVAPSAGVQAVAGAMNVQPVLGPLVVLVTAVAIPDGFGFAVWAMVVEPLPPVALSVALTVQKPLLLEEM
jgi:hypothetical protein